MNGLLRLLEMKEAQMKEAKILRCPNPDCRQEIKFASVEVSLPKHDRKVKGQMATCGRCGATAFDHETTVLLLELGYVKVKL